MDVDWPDQRTLELWAADGRSVYTFVDSRGVSYMCTCVSMVLLTSRDVHVFLDIVV